MEPSYKELLFEILSIINYSDKEQFIEEFDRMNHLEAMANIYDTLPEHIQAKVVLNAEDPEEIKKYIHKETYVKEVTTVTAKALSAFIGRMKPVLTHLQNEKISHLFLQY
ncbi:MAG: hypothetical protein ACR2LN_00685 [Candidatus Levyibacteriota bacterium]